ncbi:hypothetical protein AHMF7605_11815 [Adhaeribacter arboris]|uniref:Uncharacterized protein n=1 Tax=Adhaeribacter arboris TaxID=2072846 RepID=A0A2T2YFC0_9BACT|nr:hypothetical protein [Adhaeribacter arboris]PSR54158.1 hypothetical protein AHMF7605_11815 [Adhaeribacter arboris]
MTNTNKKELQARVSLSATDELLYSALNRKEVKLNPITPYSDEDELKMDVATIYVLLGLRNTESVQQGGFDLKSREAAINSNIVLLGLKTNRMDLIPLELRPVEKPKPTIRNISHLW